MTSTCVHLTHTLYEDGGEGSLSNPVKFKDQDYQSLKKTLLSQGKKFVDYVFPPDLKSLGKLEKISEVKWLNEVKWLRPHELNPEASFIVDGASRFDFKQGKVGNCWFLSSIGALTLRKTLMVQVVPGDQSLKDNYAGIFHFKFWRFGKWVDVVIDDLLPTHYGMPVSVSSRSGKEFWAPLLEKAYAKVCGSYGDMIAGLPSEALKDFSGGMYLHYTLSGSPPDLWDIMDRALQCKGMIGCGTFIGGKGKTIFYNFGLVDGHAFAVTGVKQVESGGKSVKLVRVWNPWGKKEWNGDWSDKSKLWKTVSSEERDQCLKVRDDGEFWIKMEDFCVKFEYVEVCCDSPNFVDGDNCQWHCSVKEGGWKTEITAGGSGDDFWTNPQYRLTLKAGQEEHKGDKNILLSLLQKPAEQNRSKVDYHYTGFFIYKVPKEAPPEGRLPYSLFMYESPVKISVFNKGRELIECWGLEPAEYLIIPSTYNPNKVTDFIITAYAKAEAKFVDTLTH